MTRPTIVLASSSPRRAALLRQIGLTPLVDPADLDEVIEAGTDPRTAARSLANEKAVVVARRHAGDSSVVLGADTIVCIDHEMLGKPSNRAEAGEMLARLSGRTHEVHTGVSVVRVDDGRAAGGSVTTSVTMRVIDPDEIEAYLATGEADDVAGAYAIQGRAAIFVEHIAGDHTNVVGLPLGLVARLLAELDIDVSRRWATE